MTNAVTNAGAFAMAIALLVLAVGVYHGGTHDPCEEAADDWCQMAAAIVSHEVDQMWLYDLTFSAAEGLTPMSAVAKPLADRDMARECFIVMRYRCLAGSNMDVDVDVDP